MDAQVTMLSGLRILLAEDNATNQMVAMQMLESLGATVTLAVDGVEAVALVGQDSFDVLLVDIEMPRLSGIEMIRQVRGETGPVAGTPMLALTAFVMREHRDAIAAAGADGVISKPILSIERFGEEILAGMRARQAKNRAGGLAEPGAAVDQEGGGQAPVIDETAFRGLVDAVGTAALGELLSKVEIDVRAAGQRMCGAMAAGDHAELRSATHILISVLGAIGATRMEALAREMNEAAHAGDDVAIARQVAAAEAALAATLRFVTEQQAKV
ncbi:MAG: response regulator [Pseudomonadota bacterium]